MSTVRKKSESQEIYPIEMNGGAAITFAIDKLYSELPPGQFLREIPQNGIDSIRRQTKKEPGYKGKIFLTVDRQHLSKTGTRKLSAIDNGEGMDGEDMVKHIKKLFSSINLQANDKNFGLGKISAFPPNPHGVVYTGWKNGKGYRIHVCKQDGVYGLKPLKNRDGEYRPWTDFVRRDEKPDEIGRNGVKVTFLGKNEKDNTLIAPDNLRMGNNWIENYLSARYTEFDPNITVKVSGDGRETFNSAKEIKGRFHFLENESVASGTLQLSDAEAQWFLLQDVKPNAKNLFKGHTGIIFDDEVYGPRYGKAGYQRLANAGVFVGQQNVVIYYKPDRNQNKVAPNLARSTLTLNSEELPLERWSEEFQSQFPERLQKYLEEIVTTGANKDGQKGILNKLASVYHLFRTPGKSVLNLQKTEAGTAPLESELSKFLNKNKAQAPEKGNKDKPKKKRTPKDFRIPKVTWVSEEDDQDLQGLAAKFDIASGTLVLNTKYSSYVNLLKDFKSANKKDKVTQAIVENTVQEFYSMNPIQAVLKVGEEAKRADHTRDYLRKKLTPDVFKGATADVFFTKLALDVELKKRLKPRQKKILAKQLNL